MKISANFFVSISVLVRLMRTLSVVYTGICSLVPYHVAIYAEPKRDLYFFQAFVTISLVEFHYIQTLRPDLALRALKQFLDCGAMSTGEYVQEKNGVRLSRTPKSPFQQLKSCGRRSAHN